MVRHPSARRAAAGSVAAALLLSTAGALPSRVRAAEEPLFGFFGPRAAAQRAREVRFDSLLKASDLDQWLRRLAARPHSLGSAYGKQNAEFLAGLFREWGYETRVEELRVLFPTPKERLVEMTAPTRLRLALAEPPLARDATSGQTKEQLPTYNAYSTDGDVTGELVYVNYGVPRDYEELARRGIDVKGKVVIARYGGSWRGIKPKVAAENGAVGCLIYSDPRDDGYFQGDVYPEGPYRNEHGAQRGSVADMPIHSGDPLTPGVGATKDAPRLPREQATAITKIPVLPISYADAQPLLRALKGPVAPEEWRGALPLTYHLGPGPATVHLKVAFDWPLVPAYDVIAVLPGGERPDEWVIRGNHHDAWVNGADDPVSGLVALLAEAKAVGALAREGWRPKRTMVYAAWDGEEQGLLGSTEWAETHAEELRKKGVAYVNSDANGRGFLFLGGSMTLEKVMNEVARDVKDPQTGVSVAERARARQIVTAPRLEAAREIRDRKDLRVSALGSGSDWTPFLQHLGIASANVGFGGEDGGGSYHSIYDSIDHYTRFGDPGFAYGVAQAQVTGRLMMRLADADVIPYEFTALADSLGKFVREVTTLADDMRQETAERNRRVKDRTFQLAADPRERYVAPPAETPVPHVNFGALLDALAKVEESAREYDRAWKARTETGTLSLEEQKALDAVLLSAERALTRPEGLPGRGWYRHQIYAPGAYTGYGVKTIPAVREALELRRWDDAAAGVTAVAETLQGFAAHVDRARAIVEGARP